MPATAKMTNRHSSWLAPTLDPTADMDASSDEVEIQGQELPSHCPPASHCAQSLIGVKKRPRTLAVSAGASASGDNSSKEGRLILAAVVGLPDGRWKQEFADQKSGANAREQLHGLRRGIAGGSSDIVEHCVGHNAGSLSLHGFMIIRSWSWVSGSTTLSPQTLGMMTCLQHKHKRSNHIEHLEHRIVTAAALDHPIALTKSEDAPLSALCTNLTSASKFTVSATASGIGVSIVNGFQALQERWQRHLRNDKTVHIWEIWTLLAHHIVHGDWHTDVTAVVPRLACTHWRPPVLPTRRLLQELRRKPTTVAPQVEQPRVVDPMDIVEEGRRMKPRGCVHPFHHGALIRAVIGAQHLKKQTSLPKAGIDIIGFFCRITCS